MTFKKKDIYSFLDSNNIKYESIEHNPVFTMGELMDVELPYPEADAKNLFLTDDKHSSYYLITIRGNKRVDLKEFKKNNNTRRLKFASDEELMNMLGLTQGSVSPFGILNDNNSDVHFFIDRDFFKDNAMIGIHPNDNTATVFLKARDLVEIVEDHGNLCDVIEI